MPTKLAGSSQSFSSFRLFNRRLERIEKEANLSPEDPQKQAQYYREILRLNGDPNLILSRIEQGGKYAVNEECIQFYIAGLIRAGLEDKIYAKLQALAPNSTSSNIPGTVPGGTPENPLHVAWPDKNEFNWKKTAFGFVKTVTWAFFILTGVSLFLENQGLYKSSSSHSEVDLQTKPTVQFADVAGVDEAKHELEEIVDFLKDPEKFTQLGGKMPRGVLLTGPPGTGKTMLARAVAGEASVPFFFMSGSEFDELYVGVGARRVRELFAAARRKSPSIIFIDELDAIGGKRNPKDQSYMRQTLNQLLVELDGFSPSEGVIVMAATNFPELLDKALVRPGRFDKHVNVPLPDVRGRMHILTVHSKEISVDPKIDMSLIARGTPGFSGAELANLVNQAALQASREGCRFVNHHHFEYAKDKILMGAERRSAVVSDQSRRMTAFHEGGHALVAMYTPGAIPLHKATIMPRGHSLGMTVQLPEMDKDNYSKKEYLAMLDVAMGGRAAEELIYGEENVTSGAHSDIDRATSIARKLVTQLGMSDRIGLMALSDDDYPQLSNATKEIVEQEIRNLVEQAYNRAKQLLVSRHSELDQLAMALLEYETLTQKEMENAVHGLPVR
jgi:ATP-dependent metalloprotease